MIEACPVDRLPPSHWWHYAICLGGPLDGEVRDVPSFAEPGRIVMFTEGRYMVGEYFSGTRVRFLAWEDSDE